MIINLLRKLAERGWIYDRLQVLAGVKRVHEHLAAKLKDLPPGQTVVDLWGGTGLVYPLIAKDSRYICIDLELPKLARCRQQLSAWAIRFGGCHQIADSR